ncbi:DNA polymerase IV, partial [hydrothermal vent metagenome]
GISYNKFLAKLASDQNKPNGQYVIRPGMAEAYLKTLSIGRFYGVGKVTESKMHRLGIHTGGDLKNKSMHELQQNFGNQAEYYYNIARGIDDRSVVSQRVRKSLGSETTFQRDLSSVAEMQKWLISLAQEVLSSLTQRQLRAYTFTIKVKYSDFTQVTRCYTSESVLSDIEKVNVLIPTLLAKTEADIRQVRLLGVSFSNLHTLDEQLENEQLDLFQKHLKG